MYVNVNTYERDCQSECLPIKAVPCHHVIRYRHAWARLVNHPCPRFLRNMKPTQSLCMNELSPALSWLHRLLSNCLLPIHHRRDPSSSPRRRFAPASTNSQRQAFSIYLRYNSFKPPSAAKSPIYRTPQPRRSLKGCSIVRPVTATTQESWYD